VSLGLVLGLGILTGAVAGCGAAALELVPVGAEAVGVMGSTAATLADRSSASELHPGEDEADRKERCANLVSVAPTVIELRRTAGAAAQWRELQIANGSGDRRWMPAVASDGAGTWRPTTNLLAMNFTPPLVFPSELNVSSYLGYAPSEPMNSSEQDELTSLIANFGAPVGTLLWNGRIYQYATAAKLPCFPPALAMK
jgi:hypothetical protein